MKWYDKHRPVEWVYGCGVLRAMGYPMDATGWKKMVHDFTGMQVKSRHSDSVAKSNAERAKFVLGEVLADIEKVSRRVGVWPKIAGYSLYTDTRGDVTSPDTFLYRLGYKASAAGWEEFVYDYFNGAEVAKRGKTITVKPIDYSRRSESWPTDHAYAVSSVRQVGNATYYMLR